MATYKLIQDIEAEDHILGPLTLRQFIFGLVAAFFLYLSFIVFVKHVYVMLAVFLPPALFCLFFAIPFGRDQPTEIWALAKLRFFFKPRRRIWDQSGIKELVTITAPKKIEPVLTNGLSQTEVESRLKALANTLDTRGWAIKNVSSGGAAVGSDRLFDIGTAPLEVPNYEVRANDDVLDTSNSPVAQQFGAMINQSSQAHRKHLMDELNGIRAETTSQQAGATNMWFVNQQAGAQAPATPAITAPVSGVPAAAPNDTALSAQLKAQAQTLPAAYGHLRTLKPTSTQQAQAASQPPNTQAAPGQAPAGVSSGTNQSDPAILSLANNNDLNVSTLARQAHKAKDDEEPPQDEVVISLR